MRRELLNTWDIMNITQVKTYEKNVRSVKNKNAFLFNEFDMKHKDIYPKTQNHQTPFSSSQFTVLFKPIIWHIYQLGHLIMNTAIHYIWFNIG